MAETHSRAEAHSAAAASLRNHRAAVSPSTSLVDGCDVFQGYGFDGGGSPCPSRISETQLEDATSDGASSHQEQAQHPSPWLRNIGNFKDKTTFSKDDLKLHNYQVQLVDDTLVLDVDDCIPISKGWGYCSLGFFAGIFPGKDAVERLVRSWNCTARISYHQNGFILFSYESENERDAIMNAGPYSIFGNRLVLCHLPEGFRFEKDDYRFAVWASLPNLPLELWSPSAIGKIGSIVGTPLNVDYRTLSKNHLDGPKFQVLIDMSVEPIRSVKLRLPNGSSFEQKIRYDFYPKICKKCKKLGHIITDCRYNNPAYAKPSTNRGPDTNNAGRKKWRSKSRGRGNGRSLSRPRSDHGAGSKPPINRAEAAATKQQLGLNRGETNKHIRFQSPRPNGTNGDDAAEAPPQSPLAAVVQAADVNSPSLDANPAAPVGMGLEKSIMNPAVTEAELEPALVGEMEEIEADQNLPLAEVSMSIPQHITTNKNVADCAKMGGTNVGTSTTGASTSVMITHVTTNGGIGSSKNKKKVGTSKSTYTDGLKVNTKVGKGKTRKGTSKLLS